MSLRNRLITLVLLTMTLAACAALTASESQRKSAFDDFMYALRWQRFPEASAFFTREHGEAFLDQMEGIKDLNISDVRLKRTNIRNDGRQVEIVLEMDYYILPSATLRTLRIPQTWVFFERGDSDLNGFLITTPFPKFP